MNKKLFVSAAAGALMAMSGAAMAQTSVTATTDLNIRSGPGPQYEVIGAISADGSATLEGCMEGSKWCQVSANGVTGWSYSDYLIADNAGVEMVVTERTPDAGIPVVTYEATDDGATAGGVAGAASGAIAGAIIGGPVGAVVGGIAGAAGGGAVGDILDPEATAYIEANPVEPVYLEGEVVVGASLPETVTVHEIPNVADYRYVYVNGVPVVVEPESRQIVYIVR
jgi:uncharacterized protein YraI